MPVVPALRRTRRSAAGPCRKQRRRSAEIHSAGTTGPEGTPFAAARRARATNRAIGRRAVASVYVVHVRRSP
jgi:hypothetical protein